MINFYFCWWATRFVKNEKEVVFSAMRLHTLIISYGFASPVRLCHSLFPLFSFIPHLYSSLFLILCLSLTFCLSLFLFSVFPSISNCQFIFFPTLLPYFSFTLFHFYRIEYIDVDERAGPWSVECRESFRWLF